MSSRLIHWLSIIALAIILASTFTAYLQPAFLVDLANRFVLC